MQRVPDCRKALEREWLSHVRGFQEQQRDDLLAPAKKRRRLELAEEEELEEEDQETCYVCYGVEKDVGTLVHVLPCGHSGACLGCLRRLLGVGANARSAVQGSRRLTLPPSCLIKHAWHEGRGGGDCAGLGVWRRARFRSAKILSFFLSFFLSLRFSPCCPHCPHRPHRPHPAARYTSQSSLPSPPTDSIQKVHRL